MGAGFSSQPSACARTAVPCPAPPIPQAAFVGRNAVVAVVGEVDAATASQLEERLLDLLRRPLERLTVDLSATTFIDSCGLAALVAGLRGARERGVEFILASPTPSMLK